jgi:Flp pilus assembly protein TadD
LTSAGRARESVLMNDSSSPREQLSKLERFLSVDPGNLRLFTDCAALAVQLEDYEALLRAANTRLRLRPTDIPAASARAKALLAKGDFQRAAAEFEKVVIAQPADPVVQQDLGLCYFSLDDFEWARAPLEAALELGERNTGLLRLLISTWHRLGMLPKAEELASANSESARTDAALAGAYARLYLDLNRAAEANEWAKQALSLDSENVDALAVDRALAQRAR